MAPVDSRDYVLSAIYYSVLVRNTCQQSLANKFIHLLEEHSELFKLQKDLHNAINKFSRRITRKLQETILK